MSGNSESDYPLVSSKTSDSGLQVLLHPLVLLTISDHITRHHVRKQEGPILGALLGQQKGREISLEHAFECNTVKGGDAYEILLHQTWFEERLKQCMTSNLSELLFITDKHDFTVKDVHKSPILDLIGWFSIAGGPQQTHLPIHRQILSEYNESAILLTFNPSSVTDSTTTGGKLPIAIYETVYEGESKDGADKDKHMQGEDHVDPALTLKFRELPYTIDTGEAEMIGVDFVARGGGNATAPETAKAPEPEPERERRSSRKGKQRDVFDLPPAEIMPSKKPVVNGVDEANPLSPEDEDREFILPVAYPSNPSSSTIDNAI